MWLFAIVQEIEKKKKREDEKYENLISTREQEIKRKNKN